MPAGPPDVINVGLMGLGVVGTGVAAHLLHRGPSLTDVAGRRVNLKKVLVRDTSLPRDIDLPPGLITTNAEDILSDPEIHVLVEVMGGTDPAEGYLKQGLSSGKHVVTANKLDESAFTLTATPQNEQADDTDCKKLILTHLGEESATGDDPESCW